MYRHQSILFPVTGLHIRFKILTEEEIRAFLEENDGSNSFEYAVNVLKKCVFNLDSELMITLTAMDKASANESLKAIYNGCVMLNPGLNVQGWTNIAYSAVPDRELGRFVYDKPEDDDEIVDLNKIANDRSAKAAEEAKSRRKKAFKIPQAKFQNLEAFLSSTVIGQQEAVHEIVKSFKLYQAGLKDENRPIGVFLFAGPSGVGKTHLAKELHRYLYGAEYDMIYVDCGNLQHKHENQKLMGSPPGYVGHDEGGLLTAVAERPNTVVLLDEVEKAHPDVLNSFLRVFEDGMMQGNKGQTISFRNVVFIMTSNLGNDQVSELIAGKSTGFNVSIETNFANTKIPSREAVVRTTKDGMRKFFKPEFINRIDSTVIFNFLTREDCGQIAELQLLETSERLSKLGFRFEWDESVIEKMVDLGYTAISNARGMKSVRSRYIDELLADKILATAPKRGAKFYLTVTIDDEFDIHVVGSSHRKELIPCNIETEVVK